MRYSKKMIGLLTLFAVPFAHAESDVKWNGFVNLVGGILEDEPVSDRSDDEQHPSYSAYENRFTGMQDSLFALQVSKPLNNKLAVTGQMVAQGAQDSFTTKVAWAYVSYDINDESTLRAGRLGSPHFYFSDFINVGTAYNWVTPPYQVYDFGTSYQGLNYLRHDTFGGVELSTEVYGGAGDDTLKRPDGTVVDGVTRDELGIAFTGNALGWLTARAQYLTGRSSVSTNVDWTELVGATAGADAATAVSFENAKLEYSELAIKGDFESLFFLAEGMKVNVDSAMDTALRRWYAMAGVRSGKFTFHLTYGRAEDDLPHYSSQFTGLSQLVIRSIEESSARNNESYTLGMRIDTTRSTALKFDVMQFEEFGSTKSEASGIGKNTLVRAAFTASF